MIVGVKRLHIWLERFLMVVCPLAMLVGFMLGTVSLMLGGALAQARWFQVIWAIVQATSLDSFLLVLIQVFFNLAWRSWSKLGYGLLVLLYAYPAYMALVVVSYQDLHASTLNAAMGAMGVDMGTFVSLRTAMTLVTLALYYPVSRQTDRLLDIPITTPQAHVLAVVEDKPSQIEIPGTEQELVSRRIEDETPIQIEASHETDHETVRQDDETMRHADETSVRQVETPIQGWGQYAPKTTVDKIREYITLYPTATVRDVGAACGCSPATAARHINSIKGN